MCISLPALVIEVDPSRSEALVKIGDSHRRVSLAVLTLEGESIVAGDWVLVNAGLALERVDEAEAKEYASWFGETGLDDLIGGVG